MRPLALLCLLASLASAAENLVVNAGFENDGGWSSLWTRDPDTGRTELDAREKHSGARALKLTHTGEHDWSLEQQRSVPVRVGDIFTLSAWIKRESGGECGIGVVTRSAGGEVLQWHFGAAEPAEAGPQWQRVQRKFVVPEKCASIQARFVGRGKVTAWLDDVALEQDGNVADLENAYKAKRPTLENRGLRVAFLESGAFSIEEKESGRKWTQVPFDRNIVVKDVQATNAQYAALELWDIANDLTVKAEFTLDIFTPEVRMNFEATGPMAQEFAFPHPFAHDKSHALAVPLNEGILYPVDDASIAEMRLIAYGGHGISMPWFGAFDPATGAGVMAILETPDDAAIDLTRRGDSGLIIRPLWEPSRGAFGYSRSMRYVLFDNGGYVAQAKRYRNHVKHTGLFKTLEEKKGENPNVDLLVGSANIWNWDMNKLELCKELKAAGVERVLFSASEDAQAIPEIKKLGYLAGRYDIFQDVFPPAAPVSLQHEGWPDDLVLLRNGDWMRGWTHVETAADGSKSFEGGVICSRCQLQRAQQKIPTELQTRPYSARFIDTTTATPWRECYSPNHSLTRSQDRKTKMSLLEYVSRDCKQITGTETGIDPAVPFVHYFEGMLSLGPYRLPDSGRNMMQKQPATPELLKFQTGHSYRVPLFELVYHDCVSSQWYWGDYNNKVPEVWARRDLLNILYGTSPMYMFDKSEWAKDKTRIVESATSVCRVARRVGYDEMLAHAFLTPDRSVQKTEWSGGAVVIVNFGEKSFTTESGAEIKPLSFLVEEKK